MSMNKYKKPVINSVKLDPEQSVLASCAQTSVGAWLDTSAGYCIFAGTGGGGSCRYTAKGGTTTTKTYAGASQSAAPS